MKRPYCLQCKENLAAVNYKVNNNTYYRSKCNSCLRKEKNLKPIPPAWLKAGYKKKHKCDRCGFSCTNVKTQMRVYYVDGNLKNNNFSNLKTLCLNCQAGIVDLKLGWKPADLVADY